jgi:hypothetical protein
MPFLLALLLAACATAAQPARVLDGDTFEMHGERIRLWGIDAPEGSQVCQRNGRGPGEATRGREIAPSPVRWMFAKRRRSLVVKAGPLGNLQPSDRRPARRFRPVRGRSGLRWLRSSRQHA